MFAIARVLCGSVSRVNRQISVDFVSKQLLFNQSAILQVNQPRMYSIIERGSPNSLDYRLFISDGTGPISPFHDIPLHFNATDKIFNMVVEIPRWTNAKMEVNKEEPLNPLKQDIKNNKLRNVHNVFPHHGYIWNYGAIPQTWENPQMLDESTGTKGDNDPIDILEIGYRVAKRGEVKQVKILGVMGLIDEGETDWKIISIDIKDPMAAKVNDIKDVEDFYPGLLKATHEWFKIYKIPDGKPPNQFAFNGEAKDRKFALQIIEETHKAWLGLMQNTGPSEIQRSHVSALPNSTYKIEREQAADIVRKTAEPGLAIPLEPSIDKWYYVQLK